MSNSFVQATLGVRCVGQGPSSEDLILVPRPNPIFYSVTRLCLWLSIVAKCSPGLQQ